MLIGVDCGPLKEEGRTGTHNYLYNLLKNLSKIDLDNEYILYFSQEPSSQFWSDIASNNKNWRWKVLKRFFWTQVSLAKATFCDRPDRLLCTWHTVPVVHRPATKIISVIHDLSVVGWSMYAALILSDTIIGVSDSTCKKIIRRVPCRKKSTFKVYEGVDLQKYKRSEATRVSEVRRKYGLKNPYFLSVGTLTKRKNLENMFCAFEALLKETVDRNMLYVVVGSDCKDAKSIREYARSLNFGDRIKFLGRLDDSEVISLYSGAVALLYVSKEEGFGLPILEAFGCLCPVITADGTSTKEVAGDAAFLTDPLSPNNIKENMRAVLNGGSEIATKIAKGMKIAEGFSWEVCANNMIEKY